MASVGTMNQAIGTWADTEGGNSVRKILTRILR
jgi:hypothetical protein